MTKLTLARWPNQHGNSSGLWLIRELPGCRIVRQGKEWFAYGSNNNPDANPESSTYKTWGQDFQFDKILVERLDGVLGKAYETRGQLILEMEAALNKDQAGSLKEIL